MIFQWNVILIFIMRFDLLLLLDAEITVISDILISVWFAQQEFSQALDSMVDVKICWRIWGICLVSMATKDRPAGRVLWSLDVGEREKSPTLNISNANELFLPSTYSCIGGTMAVIHSGADKIRGLGKSLLVRGAESKVPPMSFHLAATPPSSLIIHYCHLVSLKRRHMDCSLNHRGHEKTAYTGHVLPPRWRLPHAFKLSLWALCMSRPAKSTK